MNAAKEDTFEEVMGDAGNFAAAAQKAEEGVFDHTLFQMWKETLLNMIEGTKGKITMNTADNILRAWPWLNHEDLPLYLELRRQHLNQALDQLVLSFEPLSEEALFKRNLGDFKRNKEQYRELIARWTFLQNNWQVEWAELPVDKPVKRISHSVIMDVSIILVGGHGLLVELNSLKDNFNGSGFDDEDAKWLTERIAELEAEHEDVFRKLEDEMRTAEATEPESEDE